MSDTSDPLEILNAIDRERGESFIGMIQANQVQRLRTEIMALREALDESVRLQSHYAALLNDYDGGKRMRFNSDTWLSRLRALREKHDAGR